MLSSRKQFELLAQKTGGLYEPTEHEIARMKQIFLMIYKDIFKVCRENGLTLLLGGGSALGAIRHKGFIPWDDDIDLMMPRADYEAFKKLFAGTLSDKYVLQVPNADGCEISNLYMKVILRGTERKELQKLNAPGLHGLWVDIFPIEYAPDGKIARRVKGFLADALAYIAVSNYMRTFDTPEVRRYMHQTAAARVNRMIRMTLGFLSGFASYRTLYNFYDRFVQGKKETSTVTVPTGIRHYMGEMHTRIDYLPPAEVMFEGERAYVPANAHKYLSQLYGPDYMTPPPESARGRHIYVTLDLGKYDSEDQHAAV